MKFCLPDAASSVLFSASLQVCSRRRGKARSRVSTDRSRESYRGERPSFPCKFHKPRDEVVEAIVTWCSALSDSFLEFRLFCSGTRVSQRRPPQKGRSDHFCSGTLQVCHSYQVLACSKEKPLGEKNNTMLWNCHISCRVFFVFVFKPPRS